MNYGVLLVTCKPSCYIKIVKILRTTYFAEHIRQVAWRCSMKMLILNFHKIHYFTDKSKVHISQTNKVQKVSFKGTIMQI